METLFVIITFILIGIFLIWIGIKNIKDNPEESIVICCFGFILAIGILIIATV